MTEGALKLGTLILKAEKRGNRRKRRIEANMRRTPNLLDSTERRIA
jgi:hypothetical protein